ncbi:MAG: hypothetical protein H6Q10_1474, partial [Acidobacteria bacterium]|nr:hypothetical protein [Acidobacteriota bacterium]
MNVIARQAEAVRRSAGLFWHADDAEPKPVPLEGVKVRGEILGHASTVTLAQRFRNTEAVPIEAVYVFPLPEAAAVCGLAMRVGDRLIEGEIEGRDKAFERYDEALAAGHGAALLDQERPNVFTVSVGNILPGQEAVIELKWVAELSMDGDAIRFVLPTAVAPRYAPEEDRRGLSPTPAERVSPPIAFQVPYGLDLGVDVVLPCGVRAVDSPSHEVRVEMDGPRARVALSHATAAMDRDFVLLVTPAESGRPQVLVERNDDGLVTAAVSVVPRLDAARAAREVIFLVDRSGSMGGSSIEQVRAALHLCLRSLRDGDFFNIVGFGSTFKALFPTSAKYGDAALKKAGGHVDTLDADLGGTEILPALQSVLEHEPQAGLRRQVVLLTDGEVTNEEAVIELAGKHEDDTRIFTFGIGCGASEHLVRAVARATMGEAEFIHPGERIEPKVLRQFARLGAPALRDVKVEWQGAQVTLQAPWRPRAIFDGEAAVLYARFPVGRGAGLQPCPAITLALFANAEGTPVRWSVAVDASAAEAGRALATLAARAAIRDLEEGTSALHEAKRGSAQRSRRDERINKAIEGLAIAWRLASSQTSFVAVERREAAEDQPAAELRRVPVALTKGWGGSERAFPSAFYSARVKPQASAAPDMLAFDDDSGILMGVQWSKAMQAERRRPTAPVPPDRPHVAVARLQRADGSWRLDEELCGLLGVSRR